MIKIQIPGSSLITSRFIFGTASLFSVGDRYRRLALLEAAVEHGFCHFDTAPYYGFGWAEQDLGQILKRHPHITVTTKVGLYSPGGEYQSELSVFARKAAGRVVSALSKPTVDFSLSRARTALEGSLSRLQCERIAAYMLHEPDPRLLDTQEWQRWLEDEVATGRIGVFGVALTAIQLLPFFKIKTKIISLVQIADSLSGQEADVLLSRGLPLQITYGYVSAARAAGDHAAIDCILKAALVRNPRGALIVSTSKIGRVKQYSELLGT